jgi:hypothetical protein
MSCSQIKKIMYNLDSSSLSRELQLYYNGLTSNEKLEVNDTILFEILLYVKYLVSNSKTITKEKREEIIDILIEFISIHNLYLNVSVGMLDNILYEYYLTGEKIYSASIKSIVNLRSSNDLLQISLEDHIFKLYTSPKHSSVKKLSEIMNYLDDTIKIKLLKEALIRECSQIVYYLLINNKLLINSDYSNNLKNKSEKEIKDVRMNVYLQTKLDEYIKQYKKVQIEIESILYYDVWLVVEEYIYGEKKNLLKNREQ